MISSGTIFKRNRAERHATVALIPVPMERNLGSVVAAAPAMTSPLAVVVAGPNGAGKTTFARQLVPLLHPDVPFLNADEIQRQSPRFATATGAAASFSQDSTQLNGRAAPSSSRPRSRREATFQEPVAGPRWGSKRFSILSNCRQQISRWRASASGSPPAVTISPQTTCGGVSNVVGDSSLRTTATPSIPGSTGSVTVGGHAPS